MKFACALGLLAAASAVEVVIKDVGTYPGYAGNLSITGEAKLEFTTSGAKLLWNVIGVEPECAQFSNASNSCGIHIHEGFSCDNATNVGGHFYNEDTIAYDPWGVIRYEAAGIKSVGETFIEYGYGYEDTKNRVLVLHDRNGGRVTCADIPASPYVHLKHMGSYPDYAGNVDITGKAEMLFDGTSVTIHYELENVEPECASPSLAANSCGIHIHEGTGCENAGIPGGHYFNKDQVATDPWAPVVYKPSKGTDAKGKVTVDYGYNWESTEGRVLVVHDRDGNRVTCAIIEDLEGGITVSDVGSYPDYNGNLTITGSTQLEFTQQVVTMTYQLDGVEPECSSPDPDAANSCGIHIHEGYRCDNATIPGGHFFNKNQMVNDPWATVAYKANGTSTSGTVDVKLGYSKETTLGRVLVVHDRSGTRVTCAVLRTGNSFEKARTLGKKAEAEVSVEFATE